MEPYYGPFHHWCRDSICGCKQWTKKICEDLIEYKKSTFSRITAPTKKLFCVTPGREGRAIITNNWNSAESILCVNCLIGCTKSEMEGTIVMDNFHYISLKENWQNWKCYKCNNDVLKFCKAINCHNCCMEYAVHGGDIKSWGVWKVSDRVGTLM